MKNAMKKKKTRQMEKVNSKSSINTQGLKKQNKTK